MTTEAVKSTALTNLDATPVVPNLAGLGAFGRLVSVFGSCAVADAKTTGSTYQLVRMSSAARLVSIKLWLDSAVTTMAGDVTLYYSSSTVDGTDPTKQGTLVTAHIFKTALDLHAIVAPTEYYLGGTITGASLGKRLWELAGLSSDPGGKMDLTLVTTGTQSGAAVLNAVVQYTIP